ncbi:MAG TPA: hypothetical protein VGM26_10795 [Rhizomicrobium sp.]|jgi:hypothetical protein
MRTFVSGIALAVAAFAVTAAPASAEFFGCKDPKVTVRNYGGASAHYASARTTHDFSAQSSRPRVTIYPRQNTVRSNSVRQCRAQLVKEYRVSGTVIVPKMHCWWE